MSFFTQASFVMDPNVYGVGKLYVPKPGDGSADLNFTRASSGTRINKNGYIERARTNLFTQSNDFNHSSWAKTDSVVTGGQPGYDGTNDAWKLEITSNSGRLVKTVSINNLNCISFYVKAGSLGFVRLHLNVPQHPIADFDLSNGTVANSNIGTATSVYATSVDMGNGWYRVSLVTDVAGSIIELYPMVAANNLGATSGYIYIQDAQLEAGTVATDYIQTTASTVTVGPFNNIPRLNYGADGCPALLLEPQRTNMFSKSDYFSLWGDWITIQTILLINRAQSPEGYLNATLIEESSANSEHKIYRTTPMSVSSSYVYTLSVFAKSGGRNVIRFLTSDGILSKEVFFNLSTGSVGTSQYMDSAKMEDYGNGWYRCSATFYNLSSTMDITLSNALDDETIVYTGASSKRLYLYGIQLEQSNYVTSYIPTVGASATRITESCSKTGLSSVIGQTEGTLFVDFVFNGLENFGTPLSVNDGSTNNYIWLTTFNDGTIRGELFNGAAQASLSTTGTVGQRYKVAFAYKTNDFAFYVNGVQISTQSSGSTFSGSVLSRLDFDLTNGASFAKVGEEINQTLLFKTRLSNADLARLTSL